MRNYYRTSILGLFFTCIFLTTMGQNPLGNLNKATKKATTPLKDVQNTTREATQPLKDTNRAIKDVRRAPKDVMNEVDRTKKGFEQAGNEVEKTKNEVDDLTGRDGKSKNAKDDKDDKAAQDSTAAKTGGTSTDGKPVIIDERTDRDTPGEGPAGDIPAEVEGEDNNRSAAEGSQSASSGGKLSIAPGSNPHIEVVGTPAEAPGTSRSIYIPPSEDPVRPRQEDYSNSPARPALERADFAMETLRDLFKYADWDGPERDHTVRSVDYMLQQLKGDIDEIRKLDTGRDVSYYDSAYKNWRRIYIEETRPTE